MPLLAAVLVVMSAAGLKAAENRNYVEGQVLVKFKSAVSIAAAQGFASAHSATLRQTYSELSRRHGAVVGLLRSANRTTAELIAALQNQPAIDLVEPDYIRQTSDLRPPDDERFAQLWGLHNLGQSVNGSSGLTSADIEFLRAWGLARPTSSRPIVAVIDTGVAVYHPDLIGNVWTNASEIPENGSDDDGNGIVDDAIGYNFVTGSSDPSDAGVHGTHVAGTIAAKGQNHLGVIGVAFRSQIMALKTSDDGNGLPDSAIIGATDYCTMMKLRGTNIVAINASFGGPGYSTLMRDAIQAAGDAGIIYCAAAGNSATNNDISLTYPASYRLSNMIVVAASGQYDNLAGFSNYGATTVDLAAPGVNTLSTFPVDQAGTVASLQLSNATYAAGDFEYSGTTTGLTATIHACGLGYPGDFPPEVVDNIALIQRGEIYFADKVANAMAAGARAVIIYNNVPGGIINGTLGFPNGWIPTIWITQSDGQALSNAAPIVGTVMNRPDPAQIYRFLNGTSMATPHVAGAVAFAAMNFPNETVPQRMARILQNVTPIPAFSGFLATGGRLNLARTVDTDENELPDWWESDYFNLTNGASPAADPDHDGATNLAEWRAGTNPTNRESVLKLTTIKGSNSLSVSWPSAEGRFYRLVSAPNASTGFTEILRTNIAATPPLNVEGNLLPDLAPARFLRLEIEP